MAKETHSFIVTLTIDQPLWPSLVRGWLRAGIRLNPLYWGSGNSKYTVTKVTIKPLPKAKG